MATIIDGRKIAQDVRREVKESVRILKQERGIVPGLAVILVGDDPASAVYVRGKRSDCEDVGFLSRQYDLPTDTEEKTLLALVHELNQDATIHGILVQLPLPRQIHTETIIESIEPRKDVDGFHPINVGRLVTGQPALRPCTPAGIIELLDRTGILIEGKEAVIVGRSNIVGKPMALMLLARHSTVTICHTRTRDLPGVTRRADILVAAAGKPGMITADMIHEGALVIDVGMNRLPDGKLVGDVCFEEVARKSSYITPVPGGVGLMTRAMLIRNTLQAFMDVTGMK
ncbi:MAG: bifunctional methylenetetrahydrofolate dehydrogenase/methenyltetrahydrofolate cyclohydrolase FolD [Syntrophales bacterium]|jgi:methylenetetrahydrofolate dehydrogenase (NADP+)/methenyltetrahydrofolate cyclohydrolase